MGLDIDTRPVRQAVRDSTADYRHRLTEWIAEIERDEWLAHLTDTDNPHGSNSAHLGLGALANYPLADTVVLAQGESVEHYVRLREFKGHVEEAGVVPVPRHKAPTASPSALVLDDNETTVGLWASPTSFQSDLTDPPTLDRREYRWTGHTTLGDEVTQVWTETHADESILDLTDLLSGEYTWQCRDVFADGSLSAWSYPVSVFVHRWEVT